MTTIQTETAPQNQRESVQDRIPERLDRPSDIKKILEREELTEEDKKQLQEYIKTVDKKSKKIKSEHIDALNRKISGRLEELFPENRALSNLDEKGINSVTLFIDGDAAYQQILKNIQESKKSIDITIFIWRDDATGNQIARALLEKAKKGIKVRITKDALGGIFEHAEQNKESFFNKKLPAMLKMKANIIDSQYANEGEATESEQTPNALVDELLAHPNVTVEYEKIQNDHSKYYIFDGEKMMTGGMNIGDEYRKWHDYMVQIDDPAVIERFMKNLRGNYTHDKPKARTSEFALNKKDRFEIKQRMLSLLDSITSSAIIEMAYWGDQDILEKIVEQSNAGKKITIIMPEKANIQDSLNKKIANELYERTDGKIDIYFYPTMLHAKVIHVDGEKTLLGSANMNTGAMEKLGETDIYINDKNCAFTKRLNAQLKDDIRKSKKMSGPIKVMTAQAAIEGLF